MTNNSLTSVCNITDIFFYIILTVWGMSMFFENSAGKHICTIFEAVPRKNYKDYYNLQVKLYFWYQNKRIFFTTPEIIYILYADAFILRSRTTFPICPHLVIEVHKSNSYSKVSYVMLLIVIQPHKLRLFFDFYLIVCAFLGWFIALSLCCDCYFVYLQPNSIR